MGESKAKCAICIAAIRVLRYVHWKSFKLITMLGIILSVITVRKDYITSVASLNHAALKAVVSHRAL